MSPKDEPYIVVVEPESSLAKTISTTLEKKGYRVKTIPRGQEALRQVSRSQPALMIIDAELPDMSGYEVCRTTQSMNYHVPIILISTMQNSGRKLQQNKHGSSSTGVPDAYLKKPIEESNLLEAVSRQLQELSDVNDESTINLGTVQVDLSTLTVYSPSGKEKLTQREADLLKYLSQQSDKPVDRKALLENVWQYQNTTSTRTVDVHVAKLRAKIEENPSEPEHIITIHGIGYMLKTE